MSFEEAFRAADQAVRAIRFDGLKDIERVVLEGSWNRLTYRKIALKAGYTEGYLSRDVGPALWSVLSKALGTDVSKTNFRNAIEHWAKQSNHLLLDVPVAPEPMATSVAPAPAIAPESDVPIIDVSDFIGRSDTLESLSQWIVDEGGRLLLVSGVCGVGKTWLALKLSQVVGNHFQQVVYLSLGHVPTPQALTIALLNKFHISPKADAGLTECLELLVKALAYRKSLLILDGADGFYEQTALSGYFATSFEGYSQFLETLTVRDHQSCVVWVSRAYPRSAIPSRGCRSVQLAGLSSEELAQLPFWSSEIVAEPADWQQLYDRYGGLPALIAHTIVPRLSAFRNNLNACITALQQDDRATSSYVESLLVPLTDLEECVLLWLMISRRPLTLNQLADYLGVPAPLAEIESLCDRGLCRASPVREMAWELALPQLLAPCLRDRLLATFQHGTEAARIQLLNRYPLLQTDASERIRQWQRESLLGAIATRLDESLPTLSDKQTFLRQVLHVAQSELGVASQGGYQVGNVVNLAQRWQISLIEFDFQGLHLREADLQSDYFQGVSFAGADLSQTLLAKPLGPVPVIALSPDQQYLAVGDQDGRLLLWNLQDGRLQRAHLSVPEAIRVIAYSSDGHFLAEGREDGQVRLWDLRSDYEPEFFAMTAGSQLKALSFSPDKALLVGGDDKGTLYVWRLASGEEIHRIPAHEAPVQHLAISPCSQWVATCGQDFAAKEWNLQTGELSHPFQGRLTSQLGAVAYLPTAAEPGVQAVVIGRDEGQIILWDMPSSRPLRVLNECEIFINLALSPDGHYLAVSDMTNTLSIWDVNSRSRLHQITDSCAPIEALVFSADSTHLITGCDYTVQLWQVRSGECLRSWCSDRHPANKLALAAQPLQLLSSHDDGTLRSWQFSTPRNRWLPQTRLVVPGEGVITAVEACQSGQYWAVGTDTGYLYIWRQATQQWLPQTIRLSGNITTLAFSPNEVLLAAGDELGNVGLWNLPDRVFRWQKQQAHADGVMTLAFAPNSQQVYSGSRDRTVKGWDLVGNPLLTLEGHRRRVHTLCLSADGHTLYSGSYDGTVCRWSLADKSCLDTWQQGDRYVYAVILDEQDQPIVILGNEQTLEIWDLATQTCRLTLPPADETRWHVSVCPERQALVSASQTGNIQLWWLTTGQPIGQLRVDRPYEGMQIGGCTGLTDPEREMLYSLGATEH